MLTDVQTPFLGTPMVPLKGNPVTRCVRVQALISRRRRRRGRRAALRLQARLLGAVLRSSRSTRLVEARGSRASQL